MTDPKYKQDSIREDVLVTLMAALSISDTKPLSAITPPQASPFFKLPVELRLQIYKLVFTTQEVLRLEAEVSVMNERWVEEAQDYPRLRGKTHPDEAKNMSERIIHLPESNSAAILTTCRRIFYEATPTFYKLNIVHHSISTWGLTAIQTRPFHLKFLKALSLDYSNPYPEWLCDSGVYMPDADKATAAFIEMITTQCIDLQALCLHIILKDELFQCDFRCGISATSTALAGFAPRLKALILIVPSTQNMVQSYCEKIAPWNRWVRGIEPGPNTWPRISVPAHDRASMQASFDIWNGTISGVPPIDGDTKGVQVMCLLARPGEKTIGTSLTSSVEIGSSG